MQQATQQPSRFKADMPRIPGVNSAPAAWWTLRRGGLPLLVLALAAMVVGGLVWRASRPTRVKVVDPSEAGEAQIAADLPVTPAPRPSGATTIATLDELSKPWSAKQFTFFDPIAGQDVPAMVVRLPGGSANSSAAYWAFSLNAPFQLCQLEYVTDLSQLVARFGFHAVHPMVAAACSGTVYDPLQVATIPTGAWVRGEIVQGSGIRPPISINVQVHGRDLVADRIE